MVNAKHDAGGYDRTRCKREIFNGNTLYEAYLKTIKGSSWKPQVQAFEMTYLLGLAKIQRELNERTYEFLPSSDFVLSERGKTRLIRGEQIQDRIAKHAMCDEALMPAMEKYLIYDNGASVNGKGITFTRKRIITHLRKYYSEHKSNEGYVLLIDFSKYYDNLRHDKILELFDKRIENEDALWLFRKTVAQSQVDVSHLSDEEYACCMDKMFNSLEYQEVPKELLTGKRFMPKHMNIGDQAAQVVGISYTIPIDNYIKIVKGVKFYARYMDDSYVIHESKEYLEQLLDEVGEITKGLGITINRKKTRICKLSDRWRFLQIQYSLTSTGRIIKKINPKRLTAMRRKMKKLVSKLPEKEFENFYRSWFRGCYQYLSKQQRENMDHLFEKLKEERDVHNHTV